MMNTLAFISPGGGELILIMLVLILLFGAQDAPRMLRKFQGFMDELRRIANGFRYDMMYSDLHSPDMADTAPPDDPPEEFKHAEEGEFEETSFETDCREPDENNPSDEPCEPNEATEKNNQ